MDHFVALDRLPDGLRFPPEFEGRIAFDAERRRLRFRGFMSKGDYDALARLGADWPYRRALEDLFRISTAEAEAPRRGLRRLLAAVTGAS